uniref:Srp40 C-terminal domain-containing protein n=1 Tax=Aegilops tauschii subsp. strangulata TaxID=200361 RepID=A0A453JMK2_AEGTS
MLFVPRQVALASLPSIPAAAAAMAKEEAKKEKKSKSKGAAAKASPAPDARVLAAVAAFLESSGLPRTLAALQSEANLEGDAWRSSPVNLEDAVSKLLESSVSAPGADIAAGNEQEKTDDAVAEEKGAGKKKKNKKGGAEVHESESKASEPSAPEKPSEKADDETKEKKRKKKKDSSLAGDDGEANAVVKTDDQKTDEDEPKTQNDEANENGLSDGAPLDKGKKKKKSKSTSETSDKTDAGTAPAEAEVKSNGASENNNAVGEGKDVNEKKSKKKKKKSGSEENVQVEDKQVAGKDSAPKPDDQNKTAMDIENGEDGKASADDAVVSKKRKLEEVEGSKPPAKEDITATEDDMKEPSTASKSNKRQKLSEPKIAFQRVKTEGIKFADERLQDNSYWAKGGADSGYGAKAQEILGQVRGRDFRHEKTKKKRGTYKGGFIDLQTHSIKFNNSDDE